MLATAEKGKVIGFHNDSFYETLQLFLDKKIADKKENTAINYRGHLQDFFSYHTGKDLAMITWDDVLSITHNKVEKYLIYLKMDRGLKATTIDAKIGAVRSFYLKMQAVNKNIDLSVVDVELFEDEADEDDSRWGTLSEEEVRALLNFCSDEKSKPLIKKMYFATSYVTAIRKSCLLSLTWGNVKKMIDPKTKIEFWTLQGIDKGKKKFIKPISNQFYEELCELKLVRYNKGYLDKETDKLFPISDESLNNTLSDFCKWKGINQKERRIVLHSLRKASADKVYYTTGDIKKTQEHGNWATPELPLKTYIGMQKDLLNAPSLTCFNDDEKDVNFEEFSKEELIRAIKSCSTYLQKEIIKNLQ